MNDEEVKSIMLAMQQLVRVLYLKGYDANYVHNTIAVAESNAYNEFYIEN